MKKKQKKYLIISLLILLLIVAAFFVLYNIFRDKNSLNVVERTWINNNKTNLISFNVQNDLNNFSKDGEGVFYDFIEDLQTEYDLEVNSNVVTTDGNAKLGFNKGFNLTENDLLFFTDNYVLVSKDNYSIAKVEDIKDKTIGLLSTDSELISSYSFSNNTITTFDSSNSLFEAFYEDKVNYIVIPLNQYKDVILQNNYKVVYFFNDFDIYYYFTLGEDNTLNSIITKFYNNWIESDLEKSYYNHNYELFIKSLKINEADEATLTSKDYVIGVLESYPYQILRSKNYHGIVSEYVEDFAKFSNVDFKYKKYKSLNSLAKGLKNKKVNLAFNSFIDLDDLNNISTNMNLDYVVVEPNSSTNIYDTISSVKGNVYVLENTKLANYLSNYPNIKVNTYKKDSQLKKLMKKGYTIVLDKNTFLNYAEDFGDNYSIRLENKLSGRSYSFVYSDNDTFSKLFSNYVMTLNDSVYKLSGLVDFEKAYLSGSKVAKLARYILFLLVILILSIIHFVRKSKKIVLNTKIKKDDKLKFIDMLTSLKNRNYLNEKMEIWNQNTIYPQGIIVIDLNNIKYLNDTFGHEEGDRQIQGAANSLIKTQLDNTEIMRTDGNEFMIYLVGYSEKQVVSYIKKLLKEFKKLPYDYSAAVGFSMINDDLKLIEDAINEASEMMRENKAIIGEDSEKD